MNETRRNGFWMTNLGTVITVAGIASGVIASWGVAQYQIKDLREGQVEIRAAIEKNHTKIAELPPQDWRERILSHEKKLERIELNQAKIESDILVVKTIVERLEKKM